jgi:hypothetical protein
MTPSRRASGYWEWVPAHPRRLFGSLLVVAVSAACASGLRPYPLRTPMWRDLDERPFSRKPEEYYSPFAWDAIDQTAFRPMSRFFAVDPAGQAQNVNALDEVADSSWFTNRIGRYPLSPLDVARGPCAGRFPPDPDSPWLIKAGKPNGANPGFTFEVNGAKYILKVDETLQGPRAVAADVVGSRLFHAAGYSVPCNRVVYFDRSILRIDPTATVEDSEGNKLPMTESHLDSVFENAVRLRDGRYRALASLFLEGQPLGPFRYEGTRSDDPNDVIPHEDRRELRGMRVLSAWINHFDSREQNSLDMWIATDRGRGFVRHDLLDFGESLGSLWQPPTLARQIGWAYYLDFGYMTEDFGTLGVIQHPWESLRFGPSGQVFGYFEAKRFEPDEWRPGYPNPAFGRMQERDGAWMARIIARFTDRHVWAMVRTADLRDELLERELYRILSERRRKILARYLGRLSPLGDPELRPGSAQTELCLRDLLVSSGVVPRDRRSYASRGWATRPVRRVSLGPVRTDANAMVCTRLPALPEATDARPGYLIVDLVSRTRDEDAQPPLRVHLYTTGAGRYLIVGLERPDDSDAPR